MGDLKLYLKYIVKWVDWDPSIVPVKIYILDVTDTGDHPSSSSAVQALSSCKVEYTVLPCDSTGKNKEDCVDVKKTNIILPRGGEIVYGVAHQHTGGTGSALYGEDGQLLCSSTPFYGKGTKAGDEEGYIVGMSTCYHKPGTVKVKSGELLTVVSNYSSTQMHTGVMGLFYILVAEQQPPQKTMLTESLTTVLAESWWIALIACGFVAIVAAAIYRRGHETESYEMVIDRA
ncbi:hypothetical protein HPP92_025310 [Vanilla planifolia]|uniref:Uncharacterized protein n=1 Tax=Vanilla planifolia TaxID=51239 RepID=A0A835PF58_VANPL|nr:hypothetical protein HPP92_025310 [Vanilla planifolia]